MITSVSKNITRYIGSVTNDGSAGVGSSAVRKTAAATTASAPIVTRPSVRRGAESESVASNDVRPANPGHTGYRE